jgi:hypothetical protein
LVYAVFLFGHCGSPLDIERGCNAWRVEMDCNPIDFGTLFAEHSPFFSFGSFSSFTLEVSGFIHVHIPEPIPGKASQQVAGADCGL